MQGLLVVANGADAGREIVLEPGSVLRVGRGMKSDLSVPSDNRMSWAHFAIRLTTDGICEVRDLQSTNGLYLNDIRISQSAVGRGDRLRAGHTEFTVKLVETPREAVPARTPAAPSVRAIGTERPKLPACDGDLVRHATGLYSFIGQQEAPAAHEIARRLACDYPMYVIADLVKLGERLPNNFDGDVIFDWLPSRWSAAFSPLLLVSDFSINRLDLIERGWGVDGLVVLFTSMDRSALLDRLRHASRGPRNPEDPASTSDLVGCCWPASLAEILTRGPTKSVQSFCSGIEAILVESNVPAGWQLFSQSAMEQSNCLAEAAV